MGSFASVLHVRGALQVQFSSVYSLNTELTKRNHTWNRPR